MPELPEVEVSRLGITPHLQGQRITEVIVRQRQLRWWVPDEVLAATGLTIHRIERRAKYLLLHTELGAVIIHLGMSGNLRVLPQSTPVAKHDHVDLLLANGQMLRYHDPRRFGAWLWQPKDENHQVFSQLGPEPLEEEFNADYLLEKAKSRKVAVKVFLMTNAVVVGVGNIYANESLFMAGIDPRRAAATLTSAEAESLVDIIKGVLHRAIAQGGTTLKDFQQTDGKPGYFAQELLVYGKKGQPCPTCSSELEEVKLGQRATTFCPHCQT